MKKPTKLTLLAMVFYCALGNAQSTQTGVGPAGHLNAGGIFTHYVGWNGFSTIPLNIEHRGTEDINFLNGPFPGTNRMVIEGLAAGATQGFVGIGTLTPPFHLSLDNDGGILALGTMGLPCQLVLLEHE